MKLRCVKASKLEDLTSGQIYEACEDKEHGDGIWSAIICDDAGNKRAVIRTKQNSKLLTNGRSEMVHVC